MSLDVRSSRERIVQTLWFEGLGLVLVSPLYGCIAATPLDESLTLLATLSLITMAWAATFNTVFDAAELRLAGRVASERPHALRITHALALELTAMLVSCPAIVALADLEWLDALGVDLALTLSYAAYGYGFHCVFDYLRPVPGLERSRRPAVMRPQDRPEA